MLIAVLGFAPLFPVVALTEADKLLAGFATTPRLGFVHGAILTFLLALSVNAFTRLNVFWWT